MFDDQVTIPDLHNFQSLLSKTYHSYNSLNESKNNLKNKIITSKAKVEIQPEVNQVLDDVQSRIHQQTLGRFESLLTYLVNDVFPEEKTNIKMCLGLERGYPALRMIAENMAGQQEDIYSGKGGSILNIISVGLRFIILSRTKGLRPFIVLDEPDCWLSPKRVPAFAKVINSLSTNLGIQVLLISHHNTNLFPGIFNVNIENNDKETICNYETVPDWSDQHGIRKVHIKNFMAHKELSFPLSPNVTAITGDNDIGKSAIVQSLRSCFYGEGHDSFIRHGEKGYQINVDFGFKGTFKHERKLKGQKKTLYKLLINDQIIHETNKAKLPEWVFEEFGIGLVDDLDVQLTPQKKPVFLLNEPATTQAKLLSVGREAHYLAEMQQDYKLDIQAEKKYLKTIEKEYAALERKTVQIGDFEKVYEECTHLIQDKYKSLKDSLDKETQLINILDRLETTNLYCNSKVDEVPHCPKLSDTNAINELINKISSLKSKIQLKPANSVKPVYYYDIDRLLFLVNKINATSKIKSLVCAENVSKPFFLTNEDYLIRLMDKMNKFEKILKVKPPQKIEQPIVHSTEPIINLGVNLKQSKAECINAKKSLNETLEAIKECHKKRDKLFEMCGGYCPVCEQTIVKHEQNTMCKAV